MTLHGRDDAPSLMSPDLRVIIEARGDPFDFIHIFDERLAAFHRQESGEFFSMLTHSARGLVQHLALLNAGRESPIIPSGVCGTNGGFGIVGASARHFINTLFRRRIFDGESFSRKARHEFTVDEHFSHRSTLIAPKAHLEISR